MNKARLTSWDEVAIFVRLQWRAKEWFFWDADEQEEGEALFVWEEYLQEASWRRFTQESVPTER